MKNNPGKMQISLSLPQAERLKKLADVHGFCLAQMVTFAVNDWVFDNYQDHLKKFS